MMEEVKILSECPMKLNYDNKAAMRIAHYPIHHDCAKHVKLDRHFIKGKLEELST